MTLNDWLLGYVSSQCKNNSRTIVVSVEVLFLSKSYVWIKAHHFLRIYTNITNKMEKSTIIKVTNLRTN